MLDLSNVTLLFVETRAHEITKRVIDDCISKCKFGDILLYTDKPELIPDVPGARYELVPDFPNKRDAGRFYYAEAMKGVETDFALMLEWDAGIFDETKWRPEFFDYDYIGAPWHRPGDPQDVGNGGFTLMSRKLGRYAADNFKKFPVYTDMDVCRLQRRHYEAAGFKWPDTDLASFFAWELGPRNPAHFGYHGAFTWPYLLPKAEIITRAKLMLKSEYLTVKARQLFQKAPWLEHELTSEEVSTFYNRVPPGYRLQPHIPGVMSPQHRAALMLHEAQRRGFVSHNQSKGLKA